jgi:hypothetical protein
VPALGSAGFEAACGTLSGMLAWNGKSVEVKEKTCLDL